jgi:Ca-activated chloride channel family protein
MKNSNHLFRFTGLIGAVLVSAVSSVAAGKSTSLVEIRIEVDRPVLPADSTQTAIVKVALDGMRQPTRHRAPVNLALVIDRSGSMSGDKIARAREAAIEAVRRLGPNDRVAIVVYHNHAHTLVPSQRVGDGRGLERTIESISTGGGTNLYGGLEVGAAEIRRYIEDNYVHRVILLSDGLANVGPSSPAELGQFGADLVQQGISVSTIGVGVDFNEDLMSRLARRSDGNTYFVEHSSDLARIFRRELGDVLNVVARRVVVEVTFPAGVRPRRIVGRDGRVEAQRVVVELNQIYGGSEKFALIEVEIEPGRAGTQRELASASVAYDELSGTRFVAAGIYAQVSFSAREHEVVAHANKQVQTDYAENRIAEVKDEVIALVDLGRRQDAADRLRSVSSSLEAMAKQYKNERVSVLTAPFADEAERVKADGLDNVSRKSYRAESSQIVNQQTRD